MNSGMTILDQIMETRQKLCYTDTDSFIINIKTEDFFEDISNDVEKCLIRLTMIKMIKDLFQ